jgi:thiamine-monophosphate kinase
MGRAKTIGDVGEKELLRSVIKPLLNPADDPNSVGDDCAVVQAEPGSLFCLSTDRVPADPISFRLGIITHHGLGYYLAVLNLSDLAAMGATPSGLLLNLGLPSDTLVDDLVAFLRGANDACTDYGCRILGGDLSNSVELSLSATSFGTVPQTGVLRRRGANSGDLIYCADPIGMTATAFAYFLRAKPGGFVLDQAEEDRLKEQFRKPRARFDVARVLSGLGRATAMDNTDGVGQTLSEPAEINAVCMRIDADALPIHGLSRTIAAQLECDVVDLIMSAGADFQLVGTIPSPAESQIFPDDVRIIGEVVEGEGVTIARGGREERLRIQGWNYFASAQEALS